MVKNIQGTPTSELVKRCSTVFAKYDAELLGWILGQNDFKSIWCLSNVVKTLVLAILDLASLK